MYLRTLLTTLLILLFGFAAPAAASDYPSTSRLSSGRWVKVSVEQSGIYEISYDQLREMGFDAPERVGVFGRGGRQMPENFTDRSGRPLVEPDIRALPVLHLEGKLLFYGLGVEAIVPEPDTAAAFPDAWHYARSSRNPYSLNGYYLLSDTECVEMASRQPGEAASVSLTYGLDYWYHERDMEWNPTRSGRVAYGEDLRPSASPKLSLPYSLPLAITGVNVRLEYELYRHPDYEGEVYFSINSGAASSFGSSRTPDVFAPASYAFSSKQLDRTEGVINIDNRSTTANTGYFNLDWLLLTYRKRIATSSTPQRYLFPQLAQGAAGSFSIAAGESMLAMDVTDPFSPELIEPSGGQFTVANTGTVPEIILFSPAQTFMRTGAWEVVANGSLHARAAQGAELLIITVPGLREGAERIADIHRTRDGISVLTATTTEIYNEFGEGTPDPMAYRSLARMLYLNRTTPLRNVLLLGPLRADARCLETDAEPDSFIIAWQDPTAVTTLSSGCPNVNDWIGMMEDYSTAEIKARTISVGVGILPCLTEAEVELVVEKIERFYDDPSMASRINRYVAVGGIGDHQLHAQFALSAAQHYSNRTGGAILTQPVIQDAYTLEDARRRFADCLNSGPLMACWFGHGSFDQLGSKFFTISHLPMLRGSSHPLMVFAGCSLSNTDRGVRGIGEKMILSTRFGLLGGIVSTRVSMAFSNRTFVQSIYEAAYCLNPMGDVLVRREQPATLGEIFAKAKTAVREDVEGAYQLIADPALRIPFPTLDALPDEASLTATAGRTLTISGIIAAPGGAPREDFNGEVVIRITAPEIIIPTLNEQSGESSYTQVPYGDRTLQMASAAVSDGRFSTEIKLPYSMADVAGKTMSVYISAYDPDSRLGAAGTAQLTLDGADREAAFSDTQPPVVEEFAYDADCSEFMVTVADETALDMSEGCATESSSFRIDGHRQLQAEAAPKILYPGEARYSKRFRAAGLADGRHLAELTVRDAAGNTTTAQLIFNVSPEYGRLRLASDVRALLAEATLSVEGSGVDTQKTLLVADSAGEECGRISFSGETLLWDGSCDGRRLPAGVYTLVVQDSAGEHSAPLRLSIID